MRYDTAVPAEPDSASARIETLDILRGMALFGMIVVHFHQMFRDTTTLESFPGETYIGWVIWLGIEQKSWGMFAFLFGAGFAILLRRAEIKGLPLTALYLRRMAVLALIGVAIHVFTDFQILIEYAVCGVVLLFVRNWSSRALLSLAVLAAATSWLIRLGRGLYELNTLGLAGANAAFQAQQAAPPFEPHSYLDVVMHRLETLPGYLRRLWLPTSSFALILTGMLAVRSGVFDEPRRHVRLIRNAMAIGLASWLIYWLLLPRIPTDFTAARVAIQIRYGMGIISDQWLAFTYIGAVVLLLAWRPQWTGRLALFGVVGRMALTNYVLQCVVFEMLSSPFGLELKLRPYYYLAGGILLFAAQVVISKAWLSHFRYGPLEWVWRTLTYLRRDPIRIKAPVPPDLVAAGH